MSPLPLSEVQLAVYGCRGRGAIFFSGGASSKFLMFQQNNSMPVIKPATPRRNPDKREGEYNQILHTHAWSHQRLYCQIKYHWKSACAYFSIFYINYRFILKYFRRKWISPVQLGVMSSSSNERPEHVSPAVWQASHLEEDILHATTMQAALLGFVLCLSVLPHCLLPITGASFTPSGPSSFDLNWSFPQTAGKQLKVNLGKAEQQNKPGKLPGLRAVSWMPALW